MSTKVGVISEGPIDFALLEVLLPRIAVDKAGFQWPIDPDDVAEMFPIRKRGHGGVLDTVERLYQVLSTQHFEHAFFIILLDRKTKAVQERLKSRVGNDDRFILAIAIEEIEAWWLGDRTNTLAWTKIDRRLLKSCQYGGRKYQSESDKNPKETLHELTRLSPHLDRVYGDGNLELAREFAEDYWKANARLDEIRSQCPRGFGDFQDRLTNAFRRAKAKAKQSR